MQTKAVVIAGLAGIALFIVYKEKDKIMAKDPTFREGYLAGWFTPGPVTILTAAGLVYYLV